MTTNEALNLINAIETVATMTGRTFLTTCQHICLMQDPVVQVIAEAIRLRREFFAAGIVERGALLGMAIRELTVEEFEQENPGYFEAEPADQSEGG